MKKRIVEVDTFNIVNEQTVLAAMIRSKRIRRELAVQLQTRFFVGPRHKIIFQVLRVMTNRGLGFSLETFLHLARDSKFGGIQYLETLKTRFSKKPRNIKYHIQVLKRDAVKHYLKTYGLQRLSNVIGDPQTSLTQVGKTILHIRSTIKKMEEEGFVFTSEEARKEYMHDFQLRLEHSTFQPTYYKALDEMLNEGLARKKVSIWTGRPGMGKTTFAANVARRLAFHNVPTLICPIEGGKISFIDLMVSGKTDIPLEKLIKLTDSLTKEERISVKKVAKRILEHKSLDFVDAPGLNLEKLEMTLQNRDYSVCIIDLFEKILPDLRQDTIALALNKIQAMAKEYNVHFALLHQIRRGVEKRINKRPRIEDLKNSGGYEEVADLIFGFFRERYYNPLLGEDVFEILMLKQRRGVQNTRVAFDYDPAKAKIGKYRSDRSEGFRVSDLYG